MNSSVYVVGPEGGPFKVGIARNLKRRLTGLQIGSPERLRVHHAILHHDAAAIERAVHALLADRRLTGEWFRAALEEIIEALHVAIAGHIEATRRPIRLTGPMTSAEYRAIREQLHLSRPALARLLGIAPQTILRREFGRAPLTSEMRLALEHLAEQMARSAQAAE